MCTSQFPFVPLCSPSCPHPQPWDGAGRTPFRQTTKGVCCLGGSSAGNVPLLVQCRPWRPHPPCKRDAWLPPGQKPHGRVLSTLLVRAASHAQ